MGRRIGRLAGCVILVLLLCIPQNWGILTAVKAENQMEMKEEYSEDEKGEEEKEEEKDEEEDEEEDPQVVPFQALIPPPDGEHGYYITVPAVTIIHQGQTGVTKYRVTDGEGKMTEGCLKEAGAQTVIETGALSEGKNCLAVWMEDDTGSQLEEYKLEQELWIDTIPPSIQLKTQYGFAYWYSGYVDLQVFVREEETGSKVAEVRCSADGELAGESGKDSCTFRIRQLSKDGGGVPVIVTASDLAGNQSQTSCTLYIDGYAPAVSLEGCPDSGIAGGPVEVRCMASDENLLEHLEASVEWEDVDGKLIRTQVTDWQDAEEGKRAVLSLKEDGIYRIRLTATDAAGHAAEAEDRVLVDTKSPKIQYVEALQGKYLPRFYWDFRTEELIRDRTSVAYIVHLDGELYSMGTVVEREGQHVLEVHAVDAAGNQSSARAEFVIDHTPPEVIFENLEEGAKYPEAHTFQVRVADQNDQIRQITVNGVRQKLSEAKSVYSFTVEEEQNYEVEVLARDLAGNQTEERIHFQVIPRETLARKVIRPVAQAIGLVPEQDVTSGPGESAGQEKEGDKEGIWPGIILVTGMAAAVSFCVLARRRRKL